MHDSHFMTKKTKELMKDKKRLEAELAITKSPGTSADRGTYDTMQSKYDSTFQKLARIEEDRDLLKQKLAQMIQNYEQLEMSHNQMMNGQSEYQNYKQAYEQDQERLRDLQEYVYALQMQNSELTDGNTMLQSNLDTMQQTSK